MKYNEDDDDSYEIYIFLYFHWTQVAKQYWSIVDEVDKLNGKPK
jgi:hypothetical protein